MSGLPSLAALAGQWRLLREVHHDSGQVDRFEGTARFTRSGPRLVQDETGQLTPGSGGPPLTASRRYVWSQRRGQIEIAFADMKPFHSFPLGVTAPGTVYLCDPDRYEVAYDFSRFPEWTSVWRVDGPRKAYRMVNRFSRSGTVEHAHPQ